MTANNLGTVRAGRWGGGGWGQKEGGRFTSHTWPQPRVRTQQKAVRHMANPTASRRETQTLRSPFAAVPLWKGSKTHAKGAARGGGGGAPPAPGGNTWQAKRQHPPNGEGQEADEAQRAVLHDGRHPVRFVSGLVHRLVGRGSNWGRRRSGGRALGRLGLLPHPHAHKATSRGGGGHKAWAHRRRGARPCTTTRTSMYMKIRSGGGWGRARGDQPRRRQGRDRGGLATRAGAPRSSRRKC
jgi:hypothetical protein